MRRDASIPPDWFEDLYAREGDPWGFATSPYEAAKYDHTLAALPPGRFSRALEVGCANGVLTERLAERCDALVAVDVSDTALAQARARCARLPHVAIEKRVLPADAPPGGFDLVLISEVAYYWDRADLARMAGWLRGGLVSGGHLLLVHWIGETDYPLTGDDAVDGLATRLGDAVEPLLAERRDRYRLDLWRCR